MEELFENYVWMIFHIVLNSSLFRELSHKWNLKQIGGHLLLKG